MKGKLQTTKHQANKKKTTKKQHNLHLRPGFTLIIKSRSNMKEEPRSNLISKGALFSKHPQVPLEPCLIHDFSPKHNNEKGSTLPSLALPTHPLYNIIKGARPSKFKNTMDMKMNLLDISLEIIIN